MKRPSVIRWSSPSTYCGPTCGVAWLGPSPHPGRVRVAALLRRPVLRRRVHRARVGQLGGDDLAVVLLLLLRVVVQVVLVVRVRVVRRGQLLRHHGPVVQEVAHVVLCRILAAAAIVHLLLHVDLHPGSVGAEVLRRRPLKVLRVRRQGRVERGLRRGAGAALLAAAVAAEGAFQDRAVGRARRARPCVGRACNESGRENSCTVPS